MEFTQHGARPTEPLVNTTPHISQNNKKKHRKIAWVKVASVGLLITVALLILSLVALSIVGGPVRESKYIQRDKLQAVFLNNGQVYFGNITNLNDRYIRIANIYYLRQNQSPQPEQNSGDNNMSLVKLGCEVHGPVDEMIINKDQVNFWENLKSDGQVAKAVAQFVQQNPEGQKCQTN